MKNRTPAILLLGFGLLGLLQATATAAKTSVYAEMKGLLVLSLEDLLATRVMIASNTEQTISQAPAVVSVVTAEDIKATGATNLVEALAGVPGIHIRTSSFANRPWVYIRGAASTNTLLMLNGAPIKEFVSASGQFWKGLPVNMIERIEIVRGPGSALFGADASAGVINVITKTAGKIDRSEAGVRVGSFDSQTAWLQHGTNWNGFDIGLTAEMSHTDSYRPLITQDRISTPPARADYGYDNTDIRFSIARGNWRVLADYLEKNNIGMGLSGGGIVLDPLTRGSDRLTNLALLYRNATFSPDWEVDAELRYRDSRFSSGNGFFERPPGTAGYPDGMINQQHGAESRLNFELSGLYTGFDNHALRLGGGYVDQNQYRVEQFANYLDPTTGATLPAAGPLLDISGSPYAFLPKQARTNSYLFVQDEWNFAQDWNLTLGGRYDDYSDFGGAFNPRLALVWQTTDRLTSKLMYGEAFRAPSYFELYSRTEASVGNDGLKPELSKTWDLAFNYLAAKDLKLGFTYYQFVQSDLIALDTATPIKKYQNSDELKASGVELEAQWQASKLLRLSGMLSDRHEDSPDVRSYNVPKQQAYLRMDWAFQPKWHWNVQTNWMSKHIVKSTDTASQRIGAYALTDTTLRYQHDKQWEFAASIRNLFDVDAREYVSSRIPANLPLTGRNMYAELRYKF